MSRTQIIGVFFVFVGGLFVFRSGFAYVPETTHAGLSEVMVDYFNELNPGSPLTDEERGWIVEGTVLEDIPPRWMNHLYDPVHGIGWDGKNFGKLNPRAIGAVRLLTISGERILSAHEWVSASLVQERYGRYGGDRTWGRALRYFAEGDRREAYRTLGYILHLVQDMSVPDHTRNDPHPPLGVVGERGSPYEEYTEQFTRENMRDVVDLRGGAPVAESTIEDYLHSMAEYSNRYFFSRDTVNDPDYEFPEIMREDGEFGYGVDEGGGEFPLVRIDFLVGDERQIVKAYSFENGEEYYSILEAYFSRLSRQAVLHGVGVIGLFQRQARDAVVNREFPSRLVRYDTSRLQFSFFSPLAEAGRAMRGIGRFFANIGSAVSGAFSGAAGLVRDTFFGETQIGEVGVGGGRRGEVRLPREDGLPVAAPVATACAYDASDAVRRGSVVISEVAWMGGVGGHLDEWIELHNISRLNLDISGFSIADKTGDVRVSLSSGAVIPAGGYYVLARGASTVSGVAADETYSGRLSNSKEGVRLFDGSCGLVDEAVGEPKWLAGDNATKRTMERDVGTFGWQTSLEVGGTPGRANSVIPDLVVQADVETDDDDEDADDEDGADRTDRSGDDDDEIASLPARDDGGDDGGEADDGDDDEILPPFAEASEDRRVAQDDTFTVAPKCDYDTAARPAHTGVMLNEVAWMGMVGSASDEWIELRNIWTSDVDISGWEVIDEDEKIHVVFGARTVISHGDFFLLERTDDTSVPGISADVIYTGALSNSKEGLRLFDAACRLMDEAIANSSWPAGSNSSKGTMERLTDFSWQTSAARGGTPRAANTVIAPKATGGGSSSALALSSESSSAASSALIEVVISEVQAGSASEVKDEFVELYNPGSVAVNLAGWDVKKRTSSGTLYNLATNVTGMIEPNGFFLVASGEYTGTVTADVMYTQSSNYLAGSSNTVVLFDGDANTIDEFAYDAITAGESSERRASSGGGCVSAQGGGEFLGNGCDTASSSDFEARTSPNPQNSSGLVEPRDGPVAATGFIVTYASSTSGLDFLWDTSASSSITYSIYNVTSATSTVAEGVTSTAYYASSTGYVAGSTYEFALYSLDADGMTSASTTASTTIPVVSAGDYVVIGEILFDAEGSDVGKEFVELYNPYTSVFSLSDWRLSYSVGGGASTTLVVFGGSGGDGVVIPGSGFLLLGFNSYSSSSYSGLAADMTRSASLLNGSSEVRLVLSDDAGSEVDVVTYDATLIGGAGESLERRALDASVCVSAQGGGEFLGNGCDTASSSDFEARTSPNPQNSSGLTELRSVPSAIIPPTGTSTVAWYATSTFQIIFEWQPSSDAAGATSSITYEIRDVASSSAIIYSGTSTAYALTPSLIGTSSPYTIRAFDADGLGSATSSVSVSIASFFDTVSFYADSRASSTQYLVEADYGAYPFVPDIYKEFADDTWKGVVVYLNASASSFSEEFLYNSSSWDPADTTSVLRMQYARCSGGSVSAGFSLLFPDNTSRCGTSGGLTNSALVFSELEDTHVLFETASSTSDVSFSSSDYVTLAFYSFYQSGGEQQTLGRVASDVTRYYFSTSTPSHESPTTPGSFALSFNSFYSRVTASWASSTDSDTLDSAISYDLQYTTSSSFSDSGWVSQGTDLSVTFDVVFDNSYLVGVRATDDFGTTSTVSSSTFSFPAGYVVLPSQKVHDTLLAGFVTEGGTLGQKVTMTASSTISTVSMWLGNGGGQYCCAASYLALYADDEGSFGTLVATSSVASISGAGAVQENTYTFSPGVSLSDGVAYWLVPVQSASNTNSSQVYGSSGDLYAGGLWSADAGVDAYFVLGE